MTAAADYISRLVAKRRVHKVTIDGDDFFVRGLCQATFLAMEQFQKTPDVAADLMDEAKARNARLAGFYFIASYLCLENGEPVIPKAKNESDQQWAERAMNLLKDVPDEVLAELSRFVGTIGRAPKLDVLVKS